MNQKVNWLSGMTWTVLVSGITCAIFASIMIGTFYLAGFFDPDTGAADVSQSVNQRVEALAAEVKALREHNEEMGKYLQAWTPLKCQRELGVKEIWPLGIPGLGLPEVVKRNYLQVEGAFICK